MLHFNFKVFTYKLKHKFGIVHLKKPDEDSRIWKYQFMDHFIF